MNFRSILRFLPALIMPLFLVFGCAKNEDEPEDPGSGSTTGVPSNPGIFRWSVNNGQMTSADSSVCYAQFTTIYAYKGGNSNTVEINLSDITPGNYPVSSISGNELEFVQNAVTYNAKSGTVNISSSGGGKISGNFSVTFAGGAVTTLSGEFTDVKLR